MIVEVLETFENPHACACPNDYAGAQAERPEQEEWTMARSRTSFDKLQRDRAKKAKAEEKRGRQGDRPQVEVEETEESALSYLDKVKPGQEIPADQLLAMVTELHEKFERNEITSEEFEDRKLELFELLSDD